MGLNTLDSFVMTNGGNPLEPGGANLDGGSVPLNSVGYPIALTDAANKQFVIDSLPALGTETITYVSSESDFGTVTQLADTNFYYVLQTGIYVLTTAISLTQGTLSFAPNAKVAIKSINNENILENLEFYGTETSPALINSMSTTQPMLHSDAVNYPIFLSIKNIVFKDNVGFIPNPIIQLGDDALTANMRILIDRVYMSSVNNIPDTIGYINGGTGKSYVRITNSELDNSSNGLTLRNIDGVIFSQNTLRRVSNGVAPLIVISGNSTRNHIYADSNIMSNGTNYISAFHIDASLPISARVTLANLDNHGTATGPNDFLDPSGLTEKDPRITVSAVNTNQSSRARGMAHKLDNTQTSVPFNQSQAGGVVNVPQLLTTDNGNPLFIWTIDPTTLSRFSIYAGAINAPAIGNSSPPTAETIIAEYIGHTAITVKIDASCVLDGPGGGTRYGIGVFVSITGVFNPIDDSYTVAEENEGSYRSTTHLLKITQGTKIAIGFLSTKDPTSDNYFLFNPKLIIQEV
jgi:hypothetical protein